MKWIFLSLHTNAIWPQTVDRQNIRFKTNPHRMLSGHSETETQLSNQLVFTFHSKHNLVHNELTGVNIIPTGHIMGLVSQSIDWYWQNYNKKQHKSLNNQARKMQTQTKAQKTKAWFLGQLCHLAKNCIIQQVARPARAICQSQIKWLNTN